MRNPSTNEPLTIHYRGEFDAAIFERALNEVIRRHETLRTTFATVNGEIMQVIHDRLPIQTPLLDLSKLSVEQAEIEANKAAIADAHRLFDLGVGPLIRARIVKMEQEYHRFYITMHHVIFDGVSIYHVLLPEIAEIYEAYAAGQPSPLPEPRYQYADFALWQKRMLQNDSVVSQTKYWEGQFGGELPATQLPSDRARSAVQPYRGGMKTFSISAELTAALKAASSAEGVTLYMFLLAVYNTMLHRYSGQEDIMVGSVSDTRRRPEFTKMFGHFLNFLALPHSPHRRIYFSRLPGTGERHRVRRALEQRYSLRSIDPDATTEAQIGGTSSISNHVFDGTARASIWQSAMGPHPDGYRHRPHQARSLSRIG